MIYSRYHFNKKSNEQLKKQKDEIDNQNSSLQSMNQKQQSLLTEKELLLKEIHHRVKNNLQTSMSLLNMQSAYIDNEVALETIRISQRRMHAMSLIHQKLYQSEKLTSINMAIYIDELTLYLRDSFIGPANISFELCIQPLELDIAQALPLGLIINEAVTNSIKYGFPKKRKGTIYIFLEQIPNEYYLLTIKDNGIGLPENFNSQLTNSLGMNLIRGLSEQLQGEFSIQNNQGTQITVTIKVIESIAHQN
jgi:two-component sensor histidine kinase